MNDSLAQGAAHFKLPQPAQVGEFEVAFCVTSITYRNKVLRITGKPLLLFCLLLTKPGVFFTQAEIKRVVWPEWGIDAKTHTMGTTKYRLTELLKTDIPSARIRTNYDRGGGWALFLEDTPGWAP